VNGIERQFFGYIGRGVPYGPGDETIAPWAVAASLPFAPEIVLPSLDYFIRETDGAEPVRIPRIFRRDVPGRARQSARLGVAPPLRAESRADNPDDRKLSDRIVVARDANLPIPRH
jgi:Putative glucoamylase